MPEPAAAVPTARRSTKQPPTPQPDSPPTPKPVSTHHQNLAQYGKLGGRPKKNQVSPKLQDEAQAFESIKDKWSYISHKLADEASKAARSSKKIDGRSLVALVTSAGIAYDKRWSKQSHDTSEIELPPSLLNAVSSKLKTDPTKSAESKEADVMFSAGTSPSSESGAETVGATVEPAIDPMLLSPGL